MTLHIVSEYFLKESFYANTYAKFIGCSCTLSFRISSESVHVVLNPYPGVEVLALQSSLVSKNKGSRWRSGTNVLCYPSLREQIFDAPEVEVWLRLHLLHIHSGAAGRLAAHLSVRSCGYVQMFPIICQ